ncbi:MAG: hypothetical protein ACJ8DC_04725 [Gemmatimonadales bacterium]
MRTSIATGSLLTALLLGQPAQAQQILADVVLQSGPIAGHVVIGDGYSTYDRQRVIYRRPPVRRMVVVERAPRVLVVERARTRGQAEWRRFGYRPVTLYYVDGRYFDRWFNRAGLRQVVVYERGGRYFRECDRHDRYDPYSYDRDRHERDRHDGDRHGHDRYNWDD